MRVPVAPSLATSGPRGDSVSAGLGACLWPLVVVMWLSLMTNELGRLPIHVMEFRFPLCITFLFISSPVSQLGCLLSFHWLTGFRKHSGHEFFVGYMCQKAFPSSRCCLFYYLYLVLLPTTCVFILSFIYSCIYFSNCSTVTEAVGAYCRKSGCTEK